VPLKSGVKSHLNLSGVGATGPECMFVVCLNVQSASQQRTVTSESVVSKEHPNTVQPKARLSLFDDEDDDNDVDLFTVNSTSTTSTTTKAATVDTSVVVSYSCSLHAVKYRRSSLLLCVILSCSFLQHAAMLAFASAVLATEIASVCLCLHPSVTRQYCVNDDM